MKQAVKAYLSFNRAERGGLAVLLLVIGLLAAVRITLPLWENPKADETQQQRLNAAWRQFKAKGTDQIANNAVKDDEDPQEDTAITAPPTGTTTALEPATININTADSEQLLSLDHIGPVLAHRILERRTQLRHFSNTDQLLAIPRFPKAHWDEIRKHIRIK